MAVHKQVTEDQESDYDDALERFQEAAEALAIAYLDGDIDRDEFIAQLRELVKDHYLELALIGTAYELLSDRQLEDLNAYVNATMALIDDFEETIIERGEDLTAAYLIWRTGIYKYARHVMIWNTIPSDIALLLPEFPGVSCLGDGACGCWLEIEIFEDYAEVFWHVNPVKEHCAVCLDLEAAWSPYEVFFDPLTGKSKPKSYDSGHEWFVERTFK